MQAWLRSPCSGLGGAGNTFGATKQAAAPHPAPRLQKDLEPLGGTNTQQGYDRASFAIHGCAECMDASPADVENRIVLITGKG